MIDKKTLLDRAYAAHAITKAEYDAALRQHTYGPPHADPDTYRAMLAGLAGLRGCPLTIFDVERLSRTFGGTE